MGTYALKYSGKEIDAALDKVNQDLLPKVHNTDTTAHADIRTNIEQNAKALASVQETIDKFSVPTKTSELVNDSGYLVASDISGKANSADLTSHTGNTDNPHGVTIEQLGVKTEDWTFTLEDGSTVIKAVYVG